ncbi:MAG: PHP domain-containing protein [Candidatus Izemoplasmatales bacterium]
MIYHYDLHIHSVLSPCADVLMTPNNIINMAHLKGLNLISITDHNSLKQYPVIDEIMKSYDMLLIYGVEVELVDKSHILCYLKTLEDALNFDLFLEKNLVKQEYDRKTYGEQVITDLYDQEAQVIEYHLGKSTKLTLEDLQNELTKYDHLLFLAHVDRAKNSGYHLLNNHLFDGVELSRHASLSWKESMKEQKRHILQSSDAHTLTDILERDEKNMIEMEELSIQQFFHVMKYGRPE